FQAEDGIRDKLVTGVQTCALPISLFKTRDAAIWEAPTFRPTISCFFARFFFALLGLGTPGFRAFFGRRKSSESLISLFRSMCLRSEERRVGKECRSRGLPDHWIVK